MDSNVDACGRSRHTGAFDLVLIAFTCEKMSLQGSAEAPFRLRRPQIDRKCLMHFLQGTDRVSEWSNFSHY